MKKSLELIEMYTQKYLTTIHENRTLKVFESVPKIEFVTDTCGTTSYDLYLDDVMILRSEYKEYVDSVYESIVSFFTTDYSNYLKVYLQEWGSENNLFSKISEIYGLPSRKCYD